MSTRLVVLGDTHLTPSSARDLPSRAWDEIASADLVLHTGDVTAMDLLERIATVAPVVAVRGNNDIGLDELDDRWTDLIEGVRVAMVHDSGPSRGRDSRMRSWFPDAHLVCFGHSHAPVNEIGVDGQWLLNPGSPTQRRRQPVHTIAVVTVDGDHSGPQLIEV